MTVTPARAALFFACLLSLGGADCTTGPSDGGDGGSGTTCVDDEAARGVMPGQSGLEWKPFEEGQTLPSWVRPQGGDRLGSRVNVRITGFAQEEEIFESLGPLILLNHDPVDTEGVAGGTCTGAGQDGSCEDNLYCDDGRCRMLVSDQLNSRFPYACDQGALLVPEMSIRFEGGLGYDELDGKSVELRTILTTKAGEVLTGSVNLVIEVGEFVRPSWWDDGQQAN